MSRHKINNLVSLLFHFRGHQNVADLRMLANCCVWNYDPVKTRGQRNEL